MMEENIINRKEESLNREVVEESLKCEVVRKVKEKEKGQDLEDVISIYQKFKFYYIYIQ
jgi:DNA-binding FrmR family transcriptional regulator